MDTGVSMLALRQLMQRLYQTDVTETHCDQAKMDGDEQHASCFDFTDTISLLRPHKCRSLSRVSRC